MLAGVSSVRDIDISGNPEFFQKANKLISELRDARIPVIERVTATNTIPPHERENIRLVQDDGIISIHLTEPINGIKAGLFTVTAQVQSEEPIVHRFTMRSLSSLSPTETTPAVLGLTFAMSHPEFYSALRSSIEALIGKF